MSNLQMYNKTSSINEQDDHEQQEQQQQQQQQRQERVFSSTKLNSYGSIQENDDNYSMTNRTTDATQSSNTNNNTNINNADPLLSPNDDYEMQYSDDDYESHLLLDERIESFITVSTTTTVGTLSQQRQQPPQQSQQSESIVIAGSIANLCSATLGAGVLALPYAIYQSGIVVGILLLVGSALATICSIDLIACACHVYSANTYETLTDIVLGKNYRRAVECSIILFSIGCAVAYVIAVGDILEKSHMLIVANSRNWTVTVVWLLALVPLSMLRTMQNLQFASGLGIFSIGILVFGAAVHLYQDVQVDVDEADTTNTFIDIIDVLRTCLWPTKGLVSIITACPIIIFAFSCQCNVCAIFAELPDKTNINNNNNNSNNNRSMQQQMPNTPSHSTLMVSDSFLSSVSNSETPPTSNVSYHPIDTTTTTTTPTPNGLHAVAPLMIARLHSSDSQKDTLMHKVTVGAVLICSSLYGMVSFVTLADFGTETKPNMLSSYRPIGIMQVAMSAMAAAVVMAFPLNIFPARVTLIGLYHDLQTDTDTTTTSTDTDTDVSPTTNYARLHSVTESTPTSSNLHTLQPSSNTESSNDVIVNERMALRENNNNNNNKKADDAAFDIPNLSKRDHIILTLAMTTVTLCMALVLPNISVVFGLLGGTTSSFLGFCVPGLFGLQLSHDLYPVSSSSSSSSSTRRMQRLSSYINSTTVGICSSKQRLDNVSWSLFIGGICIGVLSTAVTFYETILS